MTIEQPKEFNRFVCPATRWTCALVWEICKLTNPFLFLFFVIVAESRFMKGMDQPIFCASLGCLGLSIFLILVVMCAEWGELRAKRRMEIKDKGIYLNPHQQWRIRWKKLKACQFQQIGPNGEFMKMTLQYAAPSSTETRRWSMVMTDAKQQKELVAELKSRQNLGFGNFVLEKFDASMPSAEAFKTRPAVLWAVWLHLIGLLLLLHGLPSFAVGLFPKAFDIPNRIEQPMDRRIQQYVWKHFKTAKEFRYFLLASGGTMLFSGGLCFAISTVLLSKSKKSRSAEIEAIEAKFRLSYL